MYVWDYDLVSGAIAFSREFGVMLGYAHDAVPDRIEAWAALVHPEDIMRSRAEVARHSRGDIAIHDIEYRVLTNDGAWFGCTRSAGHRARRGQTRGAHLRHSPRRDRVAPGG